MGTIASAGACKKASPDQTDEQGEVTKQGQWKQSPSFGKDDLLLLAKLADLAHSEVYRLQDESRDY